MTESRSVVAWVCLGRGKRKRSQREGHNETLEVTYIFIFLVMHASFMGVYVCQIVYFKYVIYHKAVTSNVVLKIVPIQKPNMFTMALFTKDKNQMQSKFISWWTNQTKCYPHKGILFSHEKDWSSDSCYWYIWQRGWTSKTLCQLKEARNKGLYIVWYYLYEIFRKGKTIGQISGCLEPEEGAERLAIKRYKGTVGVMEAFLSIVVRLDKFTKAHVNAHLNGWLSWHVNYTSTKLLKKMDGKSDL